MGSAGSIECAAKDERSRLAKTAMARKNLIRIREAKIGIPIIVSMAATEENGTLHGRREVVFTYI
jgi:hypothetical protein